MDPSVIARDVASNPDANGPSQLLSTAQACARGPVSGKRVTFLSTAERLELVRRHTPGHLALPLRDFTGVFHSNLGLAGLRVPEHDCPRVEVHAASARTFQFKSR